jgi:uncharacterized protein YbjT (DUF2867 family)
MYVITGATGNIGRRIAENLLARGEEVKVVGRSAKRLQPLVDKGATACIGSLEDPVFLTGAFSGCKAAFLMIPPDFQAEDFRGYQNRVGESLVNALKDSGLEYVVNLSSLGAHLSEGTGPILGLHDQEERLNRIGRVNIVHLRPTYFMENLLQNINLIKHQGINGSPLKGDAAFPLIATKDIAEVAGEYLLSLDFSGKSVRELLGPKDMTMNEMTRIIGKAIGKPDLPYVQFPYDEAEKAMVQMGISRDMAKRYVELNKSINDGFAIAGTPHTKENTTPTTFEEFAGFFADVYNQ